MAFRTKIEFKFEKFDPAKILFKVKIPDPILNERLQYFIIASCFSIVIEGTGYSIPAHTALTFMRVLANLTSKSQFKEHLYIKKGDLNLLLKDLTDNKHLTSGQATDFRNKIRTIYTRDELIEDAIKKADPDLALQAAKAYKARGEVYLQLYWLNQAREFNPQHRFFRTGAKKELLSFIENLTEANLNFLFEKSDIDCWLLDLLATHSGLKRLDFGGHFDPDHITFNLLIRFLGKTTSITEVKMGMLWYSNPHHDTCPRMTAEHAGLLACGLKINTSIEALDLANQCIGDTGLIAIVNALMLNTGNKLKSLNLLSNDITNEGARYLLENLTKLPKLAAVNLTHNRSISVEIDRAIRHELEMRRSPIQITIPDNITLPGPAEPRQPAFASATTFRTSAIPTVTRTARAEEPYHPCCVIS